MTEKRKYSIGAAASYTGLSTHTLRKWEERYGAVSPSRTEGGDRRYTDRDLERLLKLKELVKRGSGIGSIGELDTTELDRLLKELPEGMRDSGRLAAAILDQDGDGLIADHRDRMPGVEVVAVASAGAELADVGAEVLIWELSALSQETIRQAMKVRAESGIQNLAIIYKFGSIQDAERLADQNTAVISLPVNFYELERTLRFLARVVTQPTLLLGAPPHRFSRESLAEVARMSGTIACECPRHVARLIIDLSDFEEYSENCENLQPHDARLHALLRRTAASARALFELALIEVARAEDIELEGQLA